MQVFGKTLGVIGLGGIGAEVVRIAKGMGLNVIAWNRTPRPDAGVPMVELDTLLQKSDFVSLNLVLNDETRGFLDKARIARMKPGVILINTARGALVDEAAMIEALKTGHIRHAGLDVFHNEPLKADHPLGQARQRDARGPRRVPHAGSFDDAAAAGHRYRQTRPGLAYSPTCRIDLVALSATQSSNKNNAFGRRP